MAVQKWRGLCCLASRSANPLATDKESCWESVMFPGNWEFMPTAGNPERRNVGWKLAQAGGGHMGRALARNAYLTPCP